MAFKDLSKESNDDLSKRVVESREFRKDTRTFSFWSSVFVIIVGGVIIGVIYSIGRFL